MKLTRDTWLIFQRQWLLTRRTPVAVAFGLVGDIWAGIIERGRVTPMSRMALVPGRTFRDVTKGLTNAALITVLALPFGLRVGLGGLVLALLLPGILVITVALPARMLARPTR